MIEGLINILVKLSYFGIFVLGMVSSSTIFLPLPIDVIIFLVAAELNPYLVGVSAGIGAGIGELTGYLMGVGGRLVVLDESRKKLAKLPKAFRRAFFLTFYNLIKKSIFLLIVLMCFVPFIFDFIGIFSGAIRYDIKKFLLASIIGKTIRYLLIALTGHTLIGWFG
jgi:membrane protein YqaA with SNARE-associated domain